MSQRTHQYLLVMKNSFEKEKPPVIAQASSNWELA